jgi:hypothetical protein
VITTNLATRPFYNQRIVHFWILVAALILGLATAINVTRLRHYSLSDTELAAQTTRDESRAAELRAAAAKERASVDAKQIEAASGQAREANDLIDRRTFSWTELFNRFEATLPDQVRITSVRPHVDRDRGIVLEITVLSEGGVEDVDRFMESLVATGAFTGLLSKEEHPNEAGQIQAALEAVYHPRASEGVPEPTPTEPAAADGGTGR